MQVWPELKHLPTMIFCAAWAMENPSPTMAGDFPPSSSVTGVRFSAAARITILPTRVEPVNTR